MPAKVIEFYHPAAKTPEVIEEVVEDQVLAADVLADVMKIHKSIDDVLVLSRHNDDTLGLMSNLSGTPEILLFLKCFEHKIVSQFCSTNGVNGSA
jgi:hypothetical protein